MNGEKVRLIGTDPMCLKIKCGGVSRVYSRALLYSLLFLGIVCISKEVVILNAEILVAICFFLFLYVVFRYFGSSVESLLEERSYRLERELGQYLEVEKQQLFSLIQYYEKQLSVLSELQGLFEYLRQVYCVHLVGLSRDLEAFHWRYIRYVLREVQLAEESLSSRIQEYYLSRSYLTSWYFYRLVSMHKREFTSGEYVHFQRTQDILN